MKYYNESSGVRLSRVIAGCARKFTAQSMTEFIAQSLDAGVFAFDHAPIYGATECEAVFGIALSKTGRRGEMTLISKCSTMWEGTGDSKMYHYDTSKVEIISSCEKSLKRLCTDYLDLFLIHRQDPLLDPCEAAEAVTQLIKDGKIRAFGVSNFSPSCVRMLERYLETPVAANECELSLLHSDPFFDGSLDLSIEKRHAFLAWSPAAKGKIQTLPEHENLRLALAQVAREYGTDDSDEIIFAFLFNHPAPVCAISGTSRPERLRAAMRGADIKLTREQWFYLLRAARGVNVP